MIRHKKIWTLVLLPTKFVKSIVIQGEREENSMLLWVSKLASKICLGWALLCLDLHSALTSCGKSVRWKFLAISAIFLPDTPLLVECHPSPGRDTVYTSLAGIQCKDEAVPAVFWQIKALSVLMLCLPNDFLLHHLHYVFKTSICVSTSWDEHQLLCCESSCWLNIQLTCSSCLYSPASALGQLSHFGLWFGPSHLGDALGLSCTLNCLLLGVKSSPVRVASVVVALVAVSYKCKEGVQPICRMELRQLWPLKGWQRNL